MPIKLVGYDIKSNSETLEVTISDTQGNIITSNNAKTLLDFLYTPYREEFSREIKYFYDIDDGMAQIFRLLNIEDCRGIIGTKNGGSHNLFGYDVSYSRERNFIIRGQTYLGSHRYWSCLYHLKQYVKGYDEPTNAQELSELGSKVKNALKNIGISTPTTLNSAIAIWESSMRKTETTMIPSIKDMPITDPKFIEFAEKCAEHQGFITTCQVGHFDADKIYSYDISSAYGWALSQSRDWKAIEVTRYTKDYPYKKEICTGDVTGFFQCELTVCSGIKIHPFAYKNPQGDIIYPTESTYPAFMVLEDMLSFVRNKIGTLKVIDGYYVRFLNRGKPMLNIINRLFQMRELGDIENGLCKAIIVEMVGKSLMVNKDTGEPSKTYNPPLVAWIYSQCRLQDFDFILKNDLVESLVAVCTDEVITTKKATATKIESGKKVMGTWRQKEPQPMFVLSPGWIISADKNPHSTSYQTFMNLINDNPETNHYKTTSKQRVTLYRATEELQDISKVGQVMEASNTIDLFEIKAKQDRIFPKFPNSGKQLISGKTFNSEPIKL